MSILIRYCYPTRMVQYHLEGEKRSPEYTLGTLEGTKEASEANRVNMRRPAMIYHRSTYRDVYYDIYINIIYIYIYLWFV